MTESEDAIKRAQGIAQRALAGQATPEERQRADQVRSRLQAEVGEELAQLDEKSPAKLTKAFSYVLDDLVEIPGTNFRVGIDPLLSLLPAAGTTAGALFGTVVLFDAVRLRAPISVLARMLTNYLIDWLLGMIPGLGAIFDAAYRSNHKNVKLLQQTIDDRQLVAKASARYWIVVAVLVLLVIFINVAVPIALLVWLLNGLSTG